MVIKMPRCKICNNDVIVTLDDICLICGPPTEKQTDTIATVLVLIMECIRAEKQKQKSSN